MTPLFRSSHASQSVVRIDLEGTAVTVEAGISVAAAVLLSGLALERTTAVKNSQRGPYCMMGVCFDCLVEIDGIPNQQACMHTVADGMRIRRQRGAPVTVT